MLSTATTTAKRRRDVARRPANPHQDRRAVTPNPPTPHPRPNYLADVERVDADRVARGVVRARLLVDDHEREVAVEVRGDVVAVLVVRVDDHLAVRLRAERRLVRELGAKRLRWGVARGRRPPRSGGEVGRTGMANGEANRSSPDRRATGRTRDGMPLDRPASAGAPRGEERRGAVRGATGACGPTSERLVAFRPSRGRSARVRRPHLVVVDLAVDRADARAVVREERLVA